MNIEALCAAPLKVLPHSQSQLPLSCPVVPQLRATKPSPTPTSAEEDIATTPGYGPAGDSGHRASAHANMYQGAHRHDTGLWTCRPPRLRPRQHAEHLAGLKIVRLRALARRRGSSHTDARLKELRMLPGCKPHRVAEENFARLPHQQRGRTFKGLMKKPFAWV